MKQTTGNKNNNFLVSCDYSIKDTIFAYGNPIGIEEYLGQFVIITQLI